jgi:Holliday junction resolvasome RuvABC endonuclease subunit
MNRNVLFSFAIASGLSVGMMLGGCATTSTTTQTPAQIVSSVQTIAVQVCGFLPTAATITDIFLSSNPAYQTAEAIGQAICAAVAPVKQAGRFGSGPSPMVGGVAVHGKFVQ